MRASGSVAARHSGAKRSRRLALAAAACAATAIAVLPASSHAGGDTAASAFAVRTVRLLVENRYATAWQTLHPSHQRVVGARSKYVRCELSAPITETAISVEGVGVRDKKASIAGIGRVRAKAVTIRVAFADALVPEGVPVTLTVHVVLVGGGWRWVLPKASYAGYVRGGCG